MTKRKKYIPPKCPRCKDTGLVFDMSHKKLNFPFAVPCPSCQMGGSERAAAAEHQVESREDR